MDLNYILRAKKFNTKKSLGQNFLVDSNTIDTIASFADEKDEVLEIGPGIGFLTEKLINRAKKVVALEIDKNAIAVLNRDFSKCDNFYLFEQDILKSNIDDLPFEDEKIKVIANIPYYITSPILVHLLGEIDEIANINRKRIKEIILMVQFEVAKRLIANIDSQNKEYGLLSILAQMYCDVEIVKKVPKEYFTPAPKVDSAVVRLCVNEKSKVPISPLLRKTAKAIFNTRRKNIKNSLQNAGFIGVEQAIENSNLDKNIRGEKLTIQQIYDLSLALGEFNK